MKPMLAFLGLLVVSTATAECVATEVLEAELLRGSEAVRGVLIQQRSSRYTFQFNGLGYEVTVPENGWREGTKFHADERVEVCIKNGSKVVIRALDSEKKGKGRVTATRKIERRAENRALN